MQIKEVCLKSFVDLLVDLAKLLSILLGDSVKSARSTKKPWVKPFVEVKNLPQNFVDLAKRLIN